MRLLDLFCGAGGAGMGYHRAGFEVVGVDVKPQPHYPFAFHQADALEYLAEHGREFDVIHASPPCQEYSSLRSCKTKKYPMLIEPMREALKKNRRPYVIENVVGAPLENPLMLCGTMFGLRVIRHRLFETSPQVWFPPFTCNHWGRASGCKGKNRPGSLRHFAFLTVTGHDFLGADAKKAMDIPWMTNKELSQAIPPAYTEYVGNQLMALLFADCGGDGEGEVEG